MELKLYRRMNGLTQEQVADYLGIPKKTYQNYEREVRDPDSDVLCALADRYGITLDELVGRNDDGPDLALISNDERDLIDTYRGLTAPYKKVLLVTAHELRRHKGRVRDDHTQDVPGRHGHGLAHPVGGVRAGSSPVPGSSPPERRRRSRRKTAPSRWR
ncbi:MAG: helix-turn-helix domain-containing protein [Collinsella sp.]